MLETWAIIGWCIYRRGRVALHRRVETIGERRTDGVEARERGSARRGVQRRVGGVKFGVVMGAKMILDRRGQAAGDEQAGLGHQLSWTVSTAFTLPPLRATTAWSGACCDRRPETKPLLWLSNSIAGRASGVSVTKLQSTAAIRCAERKSTCLTSSHT